MHVFHLLAIIRLSKSSFLSGCDSELTLSTPDVCGLAKDRGEGRNFTTKWFFDMEYGGCSRYEITFLRSFPINFLIYFKGFGMAETGGIEIILKTVNPAMKSAWTLLAATPVYCLRYRDLAKATIPGGDTIQSPKVANNSFTEDA